MPNLPAVSLIVSTHNQEATLGRALESCVRQTVAEIEVICVDNASTDGTRAVVDDYLRRDARVRLITETAKRSSFEVHRRGIEAARAPFAIFLDGDDELLLDATSIALELARATGADVVAYASDGAHAPKAGAGHSQLKAPDIVPEVLPKWEVPEWSVRGHLLTTQLVREAYDTFAVDQSLDRFSELLIGLSLLARASSYASIPQSAFRERAARSKTNPDIGELADCLRTADVLAQFGSTLVLEHSSRALLECCDSVRLYVIAAALRGCIAELDDVAKLAGYREIRSRVSDTDVICAAAAFFSDGLDFLATAIKRVDTGPARSVLIAVPQAEVLGMPHLVSEQVRYLLDAGATVSLAVREPEASAFVVPDGVSIYSVRGTTSVDMLQSWIEIYQESQAELVIDHRVLGDNNWPFRVLAARALGMRTIGWLRPFVLRSLIGDEGNEPLHSRHLSLLDVVVTQSSMDAVFCRGLGVKPVVSLPVWTLDPFRVHPARSVARHAPAGVIKLVWAGSIGQRAAQASALIALTAILRDQGVDIELAVTGRGGVEVTASGLLDEVIALGLGDRVNIYGPLESDKMSQVIADADLFVSTSILEQDGPALRVAQAAGLPVVMYELPDVVPASEDQGIVSVPQGDLHGLAHQISSLSLEPDRYVQLSAASLAAAERVLNTDFSAPYAQLLEGKLPESDAAADPSAAELRTLIAWIAFYVEWNATTHTGIGTENGVLRKEVVRLRRELTAARRTLAVERRRSGLLRNFVSWDAARTKLLGAARGVQGALSLGRQQPSQGTNDGISPKVQAVAQPLAIPRVRGGGSTPGPVDVTVVIPVYNSEPWLDECLSSVLGQTGVSLEVICVNDGSTDNSHATLERYAESDSRVRIIDQSNSGQSVGRNVGVEAASGRYVVFLDSDDFWAQDTLASLVKHADKEALDLLLFDGHAVRDDAVSDQIWHRYADYYERSNEFRETSPGVDLMVNMRDRRAYRVHVGLYLTRTEYVRSLGLQFIPGIVHQDNPYTFALLLNANRAAHVGIDMYGRRLREGSTITTLRSLSSARGYLLGYAAMMREVSSVEVTPGAADTLSGIIHDVFRGALNQILVLPDSIGDELRTLDPSPEGQVAFRILRSARDEMRNRLGEHSLTGGDSVGGS